MTPADHYLVLFHGLFRDSDDPATASAVATLEDTLPGDLQAALNLVRSNCDLATGVSILHLRGGMYVEITDDVMPDAVRKWAADGITLADWMWDYAPDAHPEWRSGDPWDWRADQRRADMLREAV
jgi:hypothetical protein